ncbi:type VI secretion system PAAR protein [Grimontia sp. S25]|uniref:Type VI secretion system PAAR protein n=1 Tax=Grimontia sedimenti TaxID=2711294 RepID=A0A6M1R9H5_9GAMM|nr:type VI secretion system PAAR protein [Grimontia sedimenti]NGN96242.1 type VI secretion system PAAR protein [Grimontia sedimenti]
MGNAVVLGNIGTDHDGFHPSPVVAASPDVKVDGIPLARQGDALAPHDKPKSPPHGRSIAAGSPTVFANGKPVARTGDPVSCGGVVVGGGTVNIG